METGRDSCQQGKRDH
uniref:Uncharacterized protein n=1 Tax=Anguilla anguilla TaxID=7936 RepID=A0A0E9TZ84_ANGAN